jgi:hypothetical protein
MIIVIQTRAEGDPDKLCAADVRHKSNDRKHGDHSARQHDNAANLNLDDGRAQYESLILISLLVATLICALVPGSDTTNFPGQVAPDAQGQYKTLFFAVPVAMRRSIART